ncbi:MAG: glutamine amidotransferase [Pirellulaceae bacterium]
MNWTNLIWGAPEWLPAVILLGGAALVVIFYSLRHIPRNQPIRIITTTLKTVAVALLLLCLLEPLSSGLRPRPGANLFLVLADNSQSMLVSDHRQQQNRAEQLAPLLSPDAGWQVRLNQDFDVRYYQFDSRLEAVENLLGMDHQGLHSNMHQALRAAATRFGGRPLAGIILLTDGNTTDSLSPGQSLEDLPPVYPIVVGNDVAPADIRLALKAVQQTNFELAPITVTAEIAGDRYQGRQVSVELVNEQDEVIETQILTLKGDGESQEVRFQWNPEESGICFYRLQVAAAEDNLDEATLENNQQSFLVDRGGGPYRILYVSGRPNWEYKYLRRAIHDDEEVELVGLIRIAKREPKFDFRSRAGESTNPLFRGFENDDENAEQYDQPVLVRFGTRDAEELRDGFPSSADELYQYDALVFDDVEAEMFTQDQLSLVREFVSHRGGGFLMLGGQESFASGNYDRSPLEELLPVYIDSTNKRGISSRFRMQLTREGWLEPWVRVKPSELEENQRIEEMPAFRTVNLVKRDKPGATVLVEVEDADGELLPALVAREFGHGRTAAMLIGDFWRWGLAREDPKNEDMSKSWRQMLRWLVADVPHRVDIKVRTEQEKGANIQTIAVTVRDEEFQPLDNAVVQLAITPPDGSEVLLAAQASNQLAGTYQVDYVARQVGAYRVEARVTGPDGHVLEAGVAGWTSQPAAAEFQQLVPNRQLLESLAEKTGGKVIQENKLENFARQLQQQDFEITEPWIFPLWHQTWIFLLAIGLLCTEWGLRRWRGLP